jgi:uncharacterized protein YbaP (TraB family)
MKKIIITLLVSLLSKGFIAYSQTNTQPLGKGLLWEISGNGLTKKSYLLGTIHIIPAKDYFFPKYYTKALKQTQNLVMEVDVTDILGQLEVLKMSKMKDKELKDLYDEATYQEIKNICRDSFNVDIETYKNMKPIFVQQQLTSGSSFGGDAKSYELELMQMGFAMDKTFGGLETLKEQMQILDSISLEEQAQMLLESVRNIKDESTELNKLLRFYKEQNLDSLNALFEKGDYDLAGHETSLLDNRNRKWIPIMESYMKKEPTFFAVGAGHLGGANGVIQLLRTKGYTLKAVLK